jgi:gluconolactonase
MHAKAILFLAIGLVASASLQAADVEVVNPKARFPEGPAWHDGKLFYVEYGGNTIMTWDGHKNTQFWEQDGCGPSAVAPTPDGDFLVTCYDSGALVRVSAQGKTVEAYTHDESGHPFQGPNDLTVDDHGGVYFTASGPWETAPIVGKIFYLTPKGTVIEVAGDLHYANGVVLSPDGKTLYCNESEAYRVVQFTVHDDGKLSDRRLWVRLADLLDGKSGHYPDGIKRDSKGNYYIGQYSQGQIVVVSPEGKLLGTIDVPSAAAPNLTFSPDDQFLYVAAVDDKSSAPYWGKVYKVPNKY